MTIWHKDSHKDGTKMATGEWHSKLYDKKVQMIAKGMKLNKFPHPDSKLSTRCKYGVITSQLHRYNVACTLPEGFMKEAVVLYKAYLHKGYIQKLVDGYFEKFIRKEKPDLASNAVRKRVEYNRR